MRLLILLTLLLVSCDPDPIVSNENCLDCLWYTETNNPDDEDCINRNQELKFHTVSIEMAEACDEEIDMIDTIRHEILCDYIDLNQFGALERFFIYETIRIRVDCSN